MSDTEPLLRTSYNQQEAGTTKEERSVLLYNNRWICLLPFARKPDPRRVSKQVSREPPQAWLFDLVRSAPQAERKAPQASQFSAPQAGKITRDLLRSPFSSRSVFARAALAEQHLWPLVVHKGPPREGASFCTKSRKGLWLFFFYPPPPMAHEGAPHRPTPPLSSRAFARAPVGGPSGAAPVGARRAPTGHF